MVYLLIVFSDYKFLSNKPTIHLYVLDITVKVIK